ncbi:small acidic protein-like [Saccostrea echinata]|uniref:small acidic protein-like n=1 Tax=Saccostrea echinata TaxID=191078 RepID=UPI002A7FFE8A|nr:small acidic protein-like [Saccostrea echinata]
MSSHAEEKSSHTEKEHKRKSATVEDVNPERVHSANNWENVDLGGDERKKKFLRLMGAAKKDHHGKIIIGDHEAVHTRSKDETVHITEDLEEQFNQGLEHKLASGFKGHLGLGFHKEDEKKEGEETKESEESGVIAKEDNSGEDSVPDTKSTDGSENSKESPQKHKLESDEKQDETVKKKMKMNFVKASS